MTTLPMPGVTADEDADRAEPVTFTGTVNFNVTINNTQISAHWNRELMRQALMLAARAELGCPTADNILGDGVSKSNPSLQLTCTSGKPDRIQLLQVVSGSRKMIWTQDFHFDAPWPWHRAWLERMEVMSRTSFVEALENASLPRREVPHPEDSAAPIDAVLGRIINEDLSFLGQFIALRQLHEEMFNEGETSARLAGLVRAYAHMGLLTEYQWHPMSYALKARALLYAQRWVVREPMSASAMRHRAYAFALVGMHGEALADLETAADLATDSPVDSEAPEWVPLIERFCRYDFDGIKELRSEDRLRPLASLLYFIAHEHEGSRNVTLSVGLNAMDRMPGCYRMLDTLCVYTGPGVGQVVTQAGPTHLAATLLPRLQRAPGLPPFVTQTLEEAEEAGAMLPDYFDDEYSPVELEHRAKVIAALRGNPQSFDEPDFAPDPVEPSWAVLAKVIEETTFLQVFHRAYFLSRQLSASADDYLEVHRPVVARHRLVAYLDQLHTQADPQKLAEALASFDVANIDFAQAKLWLLVPENSRDQIMRIAAAHKAGLPNEQGLVTRAYPNDYHNGPGPLVAVSPHSPNARGIALRTGHARPEDFEAWAEAAHNSAYLAWSFSEAWRSRGDLAQTEKFLQMAAELDPSLVNYRRLGHHYQAKGDDEGWLQAMNDYLKTPELGLEHAEVRCEIAKYYAERREWDKAARYAGAAAETGAHWAISWARTVDEANQNWTTAEQGYLAAMLRYGEHPAMWYFFCQRNGRGELDRARQAAFPAGVEQFARTSDLAPGYAALAFLFEGKPERAQDIWEQECEASPTSYNLMQAAMLADRLGDKVRRDTRLHQVLNQPPPSPSKHDDRPHRPELLDLARALIADLAAGKSNLDFAQLHASRDRAPEFYRSSFNYFLACYLDHRGEAEAAIEHWKQCMGSASLSSITRTAAGFELQKRAIDPEEWKPLLFVKPPEPSPTPSLQPASAVSNTHGPLQTLWRQLGLRRLLIVATLLVAGVWLLKKHRARSRSQESR